MPTHPSRGCIEGWILLLRLARSKMHSSSRLRIRIMKPMFSLGRLAQWVLCGIWLGLSLAATEVPQHRPVRILGIEHGLESLSFNQLYQDRQGLVWIAYEQSGIGLFDGSRFHNMGLKEGLPSGLVITLQEDADGVMWVGTYHGLARWDGRAFLTSPGPVARTTIYALARHPAGGMLVGTVQGLYAGAADRPFEAVPGWNWGAARALHLGMDGRTLWASSYASGGKAAIHRWDGKTWKSFDHPLQFGGHPIDQIRQDHEGRIWASTSGALWCLPPGGEHFEPVSLPGVNLGHRPNLGLDNRGELWVCAPSLILHHRRDGQWERMNHASGLPSRGFRTLLHGRDGTLWLGGAGLVKVLGGEHLRVSTTLDGLPGPAVMAILRDRDGVLWVGTYDGLVKAGPKGWERVPGTEGMVIRSLVQRADGRILACGNASVLLLVDPRTHRMERLAIEGNRPLGRLSRMAIDSEGRVYLASTFAGLLSAPPSSGNPAFAPVPLPGAERPEIIFDLAFDAMGRLWVAGEFGLAMLERGTWRRFPHTPALLASTARFIRPTRNGDLLVGYMDPVGWTRLRLQGEALVQMEHRHAGNGSQDVAWLLCEDTEGRVWAGGAKGLDILGPKGVEHVGQIHGLPSDDCNAQAFLAEQDGQVWIGTAEGLVHFRMRQHPGLPPPPRPSLLAVRLGDGTAIHPRAQNLKIPWHSTFSAVLAAVSQTSEGHVRLEARLQGLEEAWTPVIDGQVRYSGLTSGRYALEIRSRVGFGTWSPVERFSFDVQPAWWQTWWFRALGLAGIGGLIYLLTRLRTAVLVHRNRSLENQVQARTAQLQEAKERAERASSFKSVFLATVSHELRTPLNAVRGFLDLMDRGRLSPLDVPQAVRTMKGASDTLLQLINDLLDLGRIENEALELESTSTDLRTVLETVHTLVVPRMEQKDLLLLLEVDPGVPEHVDVDVRRFSQMVLNLVGNAVKFTHRGHVRTRLEVMERSEASVLLRLSVEDTGPGMPPDLLPTLFEPYRQGEGPMKGQGTGLGLSITRHLARRMGGEVGVSSLPGSGSTFWFSVRVRPLSAPPRSRPLEQRTITLKLRQAALRGPLASLVTSLGGTLSAEEEDIILTDDPATQPSGDSTVLFLAPPWEVPPVQCLRVLSHPLGRRSLAQALAPAEEASGSATPTPARLSGHVLLVDDNPANRLLAGAILSALGLTSTLVSGGEEALEILSRNSCDLVLLDANMPGLDGVQTLRAIRSLPRGATLPVLLFTASGRMDSLTARGMGFDGLLPKPMELEETSVVLSSYLSSSGSAYWDRLAQILGGPEGLRTLLVTFLEDGELRLPAVHAAYASRDWENLGRLAHDLKSNAGHLGLGRMQSAAEELERGSADGEAAPMGALVAEMEKAWQDARQKVAGLLQITL